MSGRQDLFQEAMNQGHSAAWDLMWDRAAGYYRQALTEFPDHPQALANLGLVLFEQQQYEEALRYYQRTARAAPSDPLAAEKVAQIMERLGKLDQASQASLHAAELYLRNRDANKAIENWQRVTRLNPENLHARTRLALVYQRMGEKSKAAREYLSVAGLLQQAGDKVRAVRAVQEAVQLAPDHIEVQQALALLREGKPLPKPNRPRGGTAPLRMAQVRSLASQPAPEQAQSSPDPVTEARQEALMILAGMLFDGPDEAPDENARRGLQSVLRGAGTRQQSADRARIALHLSQVVDLQTRGQESQAAVELARAMEAGLDHAGAYFDLGFLQFQSGEWEAARRSLQAAVKHPDFALGARLLLGELFLKQEQPNEASVEFLEALKLADVQGVAPEQAGDLSQLYEPLVEAQRQSTDQEAQARLCANVRNLLFRPDWRTHVQRARQQLPPRAASSLPVLLAEMVSQASSSQLVESIAQIHLLAENGSLHTAMEEAFFALQHAPTYLPLHTCMGDLLLELNRTQEAIDKFTAVARTYTARGETSRAVELYRRVLEVAPLELNGRSRLIELLMAQGQAEEAIGEYLKLGEMYYNLADLEAARKTYTEALRVAQQSKVDSGWRVELLYRMADIDLQSLDWRQAVRILEQISTLQPDNEKARASLVDMNFRLGQEAQGLAELDNFIAYLIGKNWMDAAVSFLEGVTQENSSRLGLRRRLAELYRMAGRKEAAIEQLDFLGEALLEAGDRAGAIKVVENILALQPESQEGYLQLLQQMKQGS